ncbi:MAG: glycosyltransferase [Chloroflexi bacterium]|nr:glycosyltransferase [Chloroflexota bacterium]
MIVSLILTLKNEADSLPRLLDSIAAQTRAPDEIVICDGGSTDATLKILRDCTARLPLVIVQENGANISRGRNLAIRAARGDIICSTDAGVRLAPNWLAEIVAPFERGADVVSGFFLPDPHTAFETALAATTLPARAEIRAEKFLPSSRSVAFRKDAWQIVGGYPEWLDYCEDLIFDFALREKNFRFVFAPNAIVYFRPRATVRAFFKQYYHYARGDGKANLWLVRHVIRYSTYLIALPLALALTWGAPVFGFGILLLGFFLFTFRPYTRLFSLWQPHARAEKFRALAWVPILRVIGDVAKMLGYPVGVVWRIRAKIFVDRNIVES